MAQALTVIEPIPVPANPTQLTSLPGWLRRRIDALANADETQYQTKAQLPASLSLTDSERAAVERHITALNRFLDLNQPITLREKVLTNDQAHGVMIAGLLMRKGSRLDAAVSDQLTEDYLDAIEDLPAWCVREALRKWNRGESAQLDKKPHDFNWRPEPPTLRRLALIELWKVKGRITTLDRILKADWTPEYDDEHRAKMIARMSDASPILRAIVRQDGRSTDVRG